MRDLVRNSVGRLVNWLTLTVVCGVVVYCVTYSVANLVASIRCLEMGFPDRQVTPFFEPYCGRTVSGTEYVVPMFDAVGGALPWEAK